MESFRKAYGVLKDSTKVGLAKVNSNFKGLDIAIVKATNHVERPPKERHVRTISLSCPRADVGYCVHALSKRLMKTRSWIVAIKTLIVFHRILREGDPAFKGDLMHICGRAHIFQISNFKDDSSPLAWDCSAWVRTYALFLEERIECLRSLNYDMDSERSSKSKSAAGETREDQQHSETLKLNSKELLEQLPAYQELLYRLICCQPEGAARQNFLVQYAFALVVKESFKVYCAINDGIINLVDVFFEMPKHDAVKALTIYKKAARQADHLADFYDFCRTLELAQTFQFPTLRQPPPSFLATMEEYIKEAPQTGTGAHKRQKNKDAEQGPRRLQQTALGENGKQVKEVEDERKMVSEEPASVLKEEPQSNNTNEAKPSPVLTHQQHPVDLLCLDEPIPMAAQIEESNSLALAIVQPGNNPIDHSDPLSEIGNTTGWELALVTAPSSSSKHQATETKMAGGFDKSLLDSLYEDDIVRRQLQLHSAGYSTNYGYEMTPHSRFDQRGDPFTMSNMQMAMLPMHVHHHQHHPAMMMHHHPQQNMMLMQHHPHPHPHPNPNPQNMMMYHHPQQNMMLMQHHPQPQPENMMMMQPQPQHNMMMASSSNYAPYKSQFPQQQFNPFGDPFG